MRRTVLAALATLAVVLFTRTGAEAKPSWGACNGCHYSDSQVTLTAQENGCSNGSMSYSLTISTPHSWKNRYAVFNASGSNIMNGSMPAAISLAEGQTYTIYGVTNQPYQNGTDTVTVTPSCGPVCTDGDSDGYFAEAGCGTAADCDDGDAGVNPGAAEVCGDGIDNNCDGGVDEGCTVDPSGDVIIEIVDESGALLGSQKAGDCGKATFEDLPAGTFYAELIRDETHYARVRFVIPGSKSPARVIARAETEDDDDEASLKLKVDVFSMEKPEKITVRKLRGSLEWDLGWAGSAEDFAVEIVGYGVEHLERVTFETADGTLDAYRIDVKDKRNRAEALFRKGDLITSLVPDGAEDGDRLRGKLHIVTPGNEKVYRFRVKLED
jgi:hypothetical protein